MSSAARREQPSGSPRAARPTLRGRPSSRPQTVLRDPTAGVDERFGGCRHGAAAPRRCRASRRLADPSGSASWRHAGPTVPSGAVRTAGSTRRERASARGRQANARARSPSGGKRVALGRSLRGVSEPALVMRHPRVARIRQQVRPRHAHSSPSGAGRARLSPVQLASARWRGQSTGCCSSERRPGAAPRRLFGADGRDGVDTIRRREPSPWKHRAGCRRQRRQAATDSAVEQCPEVERPEAPRGGLWQHDTPRRQAREQRREGTDFR